MEEKTSFFKKKKEICDLEHFFIFSVSFLKKEQKSGERTRKVKRRLGMGKDTGNHKQEFLKKKMRINKMKTILTKRNWEASRTSGKIKQ